MVSQLESSLEQLGQLIPQFRTSLARRSMEGLLLDIESQKIPLIIDLPTENDEKAWGQLAFFHEAPSWDWFRESYLDREMPGARFWECNLREVELSNFRMFAAQFSGCDLVSATLCGAILEESKFHETDARWADLKNASLASATMRKCSFSGANLHSANLANCELSNTSFMASSAIAADFSGANLTSCDFSGADLSDSNFTGAKFINTRFSGACLNGVTLPVEVRTGDRWTTGELDSRTKRKIARVRFLRDHSRLRRVILRLGLVGRNHPI